MFQYAWVDVHFSQWSRRFSASGIVRHLEQLACQDSIKLYITAHGEDDFLRECSTATRSISLSWPKMRKKHRSTAR